MARLRDSWRSSLPVAQQPRNPQSESIARNRYHDPVPVVLVPPELPAERTRDEIRDTKGEPVDMHVSGRAALLILPEAGPERRQVLIGLAPILLQSRRLMRNKPEGANARNGKALLALS